MKTNEIKIKIRDIVTGYVDNSALELEIVAYNGKLNIRPAYQREFVYKPAQRDKVIDTVFKNRPLNVMYWSVNNLNYEIIDGQQRTLSIAQFVNGDFSVMLNGLPTSFKNLNENEKNKFLDYKLSICLCEGSEREKLEWFETINIAGEKLNNQELLNSVYVGKWLTDAKKFFSKTNCLAWQLSNEYINGIAIRQDILEIALKWICFSLNTDIKNYMSIKQHDENAKELIDYFKKVIAWVDKYFNFKTTVMKKINWGLLYHLYSENTYSPVDLKNRVIELIKDEEIVNKIGIYQYVLSNEEKWLTFRTFSNSQKEAIYLKQNKTCNFCKKYFDIENMEADHVIPWSRGGKTVIENLQVLCINCNRSKSNK